MVVSFGNCPRYQVDTALSTVISQHLGPIGSAKILNSKKLATSHGIAYWPAILQYSAFAALFFGLKLWLIGTYGNATPFWDQWDAEAARLYKPFLEGTLGWAELFVPHNEHHIFITRLLALALLSLNRIWNPMVQMVANAALHTGVLIFNVVLLARTLGSKHLPALLLFSLVLFGIPYAWENTLAGFQSQFYFVLFFSIACLWLFVIPQPFSGRWWIGVICAIFAFLSLASGIFAPAAAAVVDLMLYAMGLRKTWKQLFAIAILAVLFMVGVLLTPSLAQHASLKAGSFSQFFYELMAVLSWPMPSNFIAALIRNLPAMILAGFIVWKRPPANDGRWFLVALFVWGLGQAVSIAYGRAAVSLSSRYLDLFAIAILINFVCLILIARDYIGQRRGLAIAVVAIWTAAVLLSLGLYVGKRVPAELAAKRATGLAQEINMRNYLATGDVTALKDKPYLNIPYPNAERLASILESTTVREILPANIRPPLMPTSSEITPPGSFVPDGYYPSIPKRTGMTLGSYSRKGDAATGRATIRFDPNKQGTLLAIPVSGYPLKDGIKLEIEQNGQRKPVFLPNNPKESWKMVYIKVDKGSFSILLSDFNRGTSGWMAVGAPFVAGRLDAFINLLLAKSYVFMLLGLITGILLLILYGLKSFVNNA